MNFAFVWIRLKKIWNIWITYFASADLNFDLDCLSSIRIHVFVEENSSNCVHSERQNKIQVQLIFGTNYLNAKKTVCFHSIWDINSNEFEHFVNTFLDLNSHVCLKYWKHNSFLFMTCLLLDHFISFCALWIAWYLLVCINSNLWYSYCLSN